MIWPQMHSVCSGGYFYIRITGLVLFYCAECACACVNLHTKVKVTIFAMIKQQVMKTRLFLIFILLAGGICRQAEARIELIRYGDFQNWVKRTIKESAVIGGETKTIYAIGPSQSVSGNVAYKPLGGSPWASSNVYAKVMGVVKASSSVIPVNKYGSRVACCMTVLEKVKALGIVNMDVMVAGSIFLGRVFEPISSPKGPFTKMEMGIPFKGRPKALVFDYAVEMPNVNTRVKATGYGAKKTLQGRDNAEVYILLQRRWEDAKGNIYAHRVGTGRERYSRSIVWTKGHRLPVQYGDISSRPGYKSWQGLLNGDKAYYARNSKGKLVPVREIGWDDASATPTHILVMASSSCGTPFVGTEGIKLYIDNIGLEY